MLELVDRIIVLADGKIALGWTQRQGPSTVAGSKMSKQLSRSIRKADIILYTSLLFWVIMFLWSYFATLEEVTRGQGRVIASSKIQVIQNLEGGIVKEILVQTGDEVTQSQPLIKLDETQFKADLAAMQQNRAALEANIATLTCGEPGGCPGI